MSGSPGGLRAVLTVAAASSIGAASGPREASRGGGQRHSRIPFCRSGLQAGCGRTSQCSTRQTDIQQQASAAQRVPGPARHLGALAVTLPTGCLQPVGLAPALVARGPACCSATSKKRTFKDCRNRTFKVCANTRPASAKTADISETSMESIACDPKRRGSDRRFPDVPPNARTGVQPVATSCRADGRVRRTLGTNRILLRPPLVTMEGG